MDAANDSPGFRILGALAYERNGDAIPLGTHRQKSLLALLLINRGRVLSTDAILDELWGEEGVDRQNALWVHVSHLRSRLEPERPPRSEGTILLTRPPGYMLDVPNDNVDAAIFERLVKEGRSLLAHDPSAAAMVFAEALAMWRGRALEEFTYESFAQAEISRLDALRSEAVEGRIDADLARGRGQELVAELEGLVRENPLREHLTAQYMTALYRGQRRAEALRAYDALEERLRSELGVDPSRELRDVMQQVLDGDPRLQPVAAGSGSTAEPGLAVRGYELRARIGDADYGGVYRAYQPAIGREVSLKVIRPEVANDPEFIRRFEARESALASLGSLGLLPVYDFWREPDAAFLVEKLVTGGDLRSALHDGPVATERAMGFVETIAGTLDAAHGMGVTHGDLRLDRILLGEDGAVYVTDFGFTPQAQEGIAADVAGLALCTAQLMTGELLPPGQVLEGVDQPWAEVVGRALRSPGIPSVTDFMDALRVATGRAPAKTASRANPFRGLHSFDEADSDVFFGRERLVDRLIARLGSHGSLGRFVAVVGPSGSGKSSVVRAGLIPALRASAVPGSEDWFVASMSPGPRPFESLERSLTGIARGNIPTLLERLRLGPDGLRRVIEEVLPDDSSPLVLVVDQFEEIYTLPNDEEREAFVESLLDAIEHPRSRVRVVITLRADFFDHPLRSQQLGELMKEHTELVTPMSVLELERAIESPARAVGVAVEPALLAALAADTVTEPSSLPMLQYTLTELFERRSGQTMTLESLEQIGGVSGSVVGRAEALFADLTPQGQAMTRQVFLRLVSINDLGTDTRRRVLVSELHGIGKEERGVIDEILHSFARHRLLTFDRDPASRAPTVEIAHESLLVAWGRLRAWVEAAREDLRAQRRLAAVTQEWLSQGRDADYLLGGASLARYRTWNSDPPVRLTPDEEAFLHAAEETQASRDRATEEQERRHVKLRRRTRALVGLMVGSTALVILAVIALAERQRAQDFAAAIEGDNRARQLVTSSGLAVVDDPELAIGLAIEAIRTTEDRGHALPEAVDALHWAIQQATIEYPADDRGIPVTVRPHSGGPRGVFVMTPADLVELAQSGAELGFTAADCERYFADRTCPDPTLPIADGTTVAGGLDTYMEASDVGLPLVGTEVVITSGWVGDMADAIAADFAALGLGQGVSIIHQSARAAETHEALGPKGDPGDLVVMPGPQYIPASLEQRPLVDVGSYLGEDYLTDSYGDHVMSLSRVDGSTYGVPHGIDPKSLIWYDPATFDSAGYDVPETWEELIALSDRMVADGRVPWCLGVGSGEVTGWMATDWLENFVLQSEGPAFYDRWMSHEIRFDHPGVVGALEKLGVLARTPGYVLDRSIVDTGWEEAIWLGSDTPPQCLLIPSPTWTPGWSAGADLQPMRFPAENPSYAIAMEGGTAPTVALSDRPETRVAMRALASADWGTHIAQSEEPTWFYPAHGDFDLDLFENPMQRELAYAVTEANAADMFRFDVSDWIPEEIGFDSLNAALVAYLSDPEMSAAEALAQVEEAWTELESRD